MSQHELDGLHGDINHIEVNNEIYQVQSAEFEDERFFFIKRSGEVLCMIMQNERNEWEPDSTMSQELFDQIMKWIKKLYLQ
jgi:hypothetical protein